MTGCHPAQGENLTRQLNEIITDGRHQVYLSRLMETQQQKLILQVQIQTRIRL
jgi:hypothetical protein